MKEIIINSKTYGQKVVQVDDEDFESVSQYKWHVWKRRNAFYAVRKVYKGVDVLMHRQILGLTDSNILTDHIDHNGLNNQRFNIRAATHAQNSANRIRHTTGTSQYIGVHWQTRSKKWVAKITHRDRVRHIGYFKNEIEAALAYKKVAIELHGNFANLIELNNIQTIHK